MPSTVVVEISHRYSLGNDQIAACLDLRRFYNAVYRNIPYRMDTETAAYISMDVYVSHKINVTRREIYISADLKYGFDLEAAAAEFHTS